MFYKKWYAVTIRSAQVARGREKVENHWLFSDAAKYLLAASVTPKSLSVSKLFHMTCLAHFAQLLLYESQISLSVAYAGFSKGGARKFENNADQTKNFSTQNQFSCRKIRWKPKKKVFTQN